MFLSVFIFRPVLFLDNCHLVIEMNKHYFRIILAEMFYMHKLSSVWKADLANTSIFVLFAEKNIARLLRSYNVSYF